MNRIAVLLLASTTSTAYAGTAEIIDAVESRAQAHGGIADDIAVVRVERTVNA